MATGINIPISYSAGSIDQILKDFDAIISQADISKVFVKDQEKIRAQFATIAQTIQEQLSTGQIDLTKVNFTGLEKDIEDFARKVAFVLNEAFEKEVAPYAKKITDITDQIVLKQKELADLQKQAADIGGAERDQFKQKYGLSRMPTLDKTEAKRKLAAAEEELAGNAGNSDLQKKVEMYRELLEMLSTEKERKKEIQQQISKKEVEVLSLTNEKKAVQIQLDKAQAKLGADAANYSQKLLDLNRLLIVAKENGIQLSEEQIKLLKEQADATDKTTKAGKREEKGLIARAGASFSYGLILGQLRRVYQQSLRTILELDKAMTEAAIVTDMNREEAYKLLGAYQQLARETGLATSEISGVVVEFLKQGRTMNEAMELAKVAAMSAKVAGISAEEAVKYLTSAVNGFGLAASQAEMIADKFSAISAASATDFEELAVAMSKVAPVAKSAGVGVDFMMGVLAKGLETTREAPENIGTAFKTIFARMREVTDIGKATEDGMSLNRVEKALASIGVPLRDVTGQFRNLENVLIDVGDKWDTLTTIEQAYIATALAGTRQQPRLLAIFNDFARTKELIQISTDATGQLAFQHMEYMEGAAAALSQLRTAWEGFIMAFTDTGMVIDAIRGITDILNGIVNMFETIGDSAFRNAALIGLVGMAFVALAPRYSQNLILQMQDLAIKTQLKNKTDELQREYDQLSESIRKTSGAQRDLLLAQRDQFVANNNLQIGFRATTKAIFTTIGATIKAMAVTFAWTVAIAAVTWIITEAVKLIAEMSKGAKELSQDIQKNNKELNDLKTKTENIQDLAKEFEQLSKKVIKSEEDLKRLKTIADELSEVKIGDQTFQLTRTDISGNIVFDKSQYEAFIAAAENARQELLTKNMDSFTRALAKDGVRAFEQFTIMAMAKDIGYGFGLDFLNGVKTSLNEKQVTDIMSQLRSGINNIAPDLFTDIQFKTGSLGSTVANLARSYYQDMMKGATSLEEMTQRIKDSLTAEGLVEGSDKFNERLSTALDQLKMVTTATFNEEKARAYANIFTGILVSASEYVNNNTDENSTIQQVLNARLESYRLAVKEIETSALSDVEKEVTLKFLSQSMYDEAIMNSLLVDRGLSMDVIINMVERGASLQEINDFIENFGRDLRELDSTASESDIQKYMTQYADAIGELFSGNYQKGYKDLYGLLSVFGNSADITRGINEISNALGLLNATTAASSLKDSGDMMQDLLKLPEQIAKGDFSKFTDLVAKFGLDSVTAVLDGSTPALEKFIKDQKDKFEQDIMSAIDNIKAANMILNNGVLDLSDAEADQIAQLEIMLKYYDQIAGVELLRKSVLKDIKEMVKETNDLYSLQEKLLKGGMASDNKFIKMLDKAIEFSEKETLDKLGEQLTKDIDTLKSLGQFVNNVFKPFADSETMNVDSAMKNMIETLTQLVDIQTAAYNKQAKAIEERYKTEVEAMKSAHDEKWSQIDYNNKLLETEEKIIDARRQLVGLALSGAAKGEYKEAQKALEKLQQEREKIIETQMLDEAQKQLEQQRNDDLIKAQTEFTNAIKEYTDALYAITASGASGGAGGEPTGPRIITTYEQMAFKFDETKFSLDDLKVSNMVSVEKTSELIDVNSLLIEELGQLNETISNWRITFANSGATAGTNTDALGTV